MYSVSVCCCLMFILMSAVLCVSTVQCSLFTLLAVSHYRVVAISSFSVA